MNLRIRNFWLCLLAGVGLGFSPNSSAHDDEKSRKDLTLLLKWKHQFQFAGFYAAQIRNYYKEKGLEVTLVEVTEGTDPLQQIKNGKVDIAITDATDALIHFSKGGQIRSLGVIFQESPYVFLTLGNSGITTPAGLMGRKLSLDNVPSRGAAIFHSLMHYEGLDSTGVALVKPNWRGDYQGLLDGTIDARSGYVTNELIRYRMDGHDVQAIRPADYGVNFYGDTLVVSEQFAAENRKVLAKFLEATADGWEYAFRNVQPITEYIMELPGVKERQKTVELLQAEAEAMRSLVLPELVKVGHQSERRWTRMLESLTAGGYVADTDQKSLNGFLFDPKMSNWQAARSQLIGWIGLLFFLLGGALLWLYSLRNLARLRSDQLKMKNKELAVSLQEANSLTSIAEEAVQAKDRFLSHISHEMRTPLNAIVGFSQLLFEQEKDEQKKADLSLITERGHYLDALVNDILMFAREGKEGDAQFELEEMDLRTFLKDTLRGLSLEAANVESALRLDYPESLPVEFKLPRHPLMKITSSLVVNAIQHSGSNTIEVSVRRSDEDQSLCIDVKDDGKGIGDEEKSRIFEAFYRVDGKEKARVSGIGIGLSMVQGLTEKIGATIQVTNNTPKGSVFTVKFPLRIVGMETTESSSGIKDQNPTDQKTGPRLQLVRDEQESASSQTDSTQFNSKTSSKGTILVIDDQDLNLKLIERFLKKIGFNSKLVGGGAEAQEILLRGETFDYIFCDLNMPGMSGFEFVEWYRQEEKMDIPIIAITAANTVEVMEECKDSGFTGFMAKPISLNKIQSLLFTLKDPEQKTDGTYRYFVV